MLLRDPARRRASATATTASSGRAPSSRRGRRRVATRHGYAVRFAADRPGRSDARRADADGGVHADEHDHRSPSCRSSCWSAAGLRQVDVRARALPADRGPLVRLLPRPGRPTTRTTRRPPTTRSRCCTSSRQAARGRPADRRRRDQRAARGRKPLVALAREYHVLPVAIVLDLPERVCQRAQPRPARPRLRPARRPPASATQLRRSLTQPAARGLPPRLRAARRRGDRRRDGRARSRCGPTAATSTARSTSSATSTAAATSSSSCCATLGWHVDATTASTASPPRRAPSASSSATSSTAGPTYAGGAAARDEHGRAGDGAVRARQPRHQACCASCAAATSRSPTAWPRSLAQLDAEPPSSATQVADVPRRARQPLRARRRQARRRPRRAEARRMQGRGSGAVRDFALYGETTGETDEFGLPVRYNWAREYRGQRDGRLRPHAGARGRVAEPHDQHRHRLRLRRQADRAALPERELVSVPARRDLLRAAEAARRRSQPTARAERDDDVLDSTTCSASASSRRACTARVTIREENATAALEVMSRFALDPRWLIYLPPTMSPPATTHATGLLEHPAEAFAYFRATGVDAGRLRGEAHGLARRRRRLPRRRRRARAASASPTATAGVDLHPHRPPVLRRRALESASSSSASARRSTRPDSGTSSTPTGSCLDCELMPWSAKAQELLRTQYAAVGAAATATLPPSDAVLDSDAARAASTCATRSRRDRASGSTMAERFVDAYRRYCWPVDVARRPASSRRSTCSPARAACTLDRDHAWHMDARRPARRGRPDVVPRAPRTSTVDLADPASEAAAIAWWEELTARGGEGMVVKPLDVRRARRSAASCSPASSAAAASTCASSTAPEYTLPEQPRAPARARPRPQASLALREFALGIEALERFVARRAAAPRPRVRLRRPGAGERAGRSAALSDPRL